MNKTDIIINHKKIGFICGDKTVKFKEDIPNIVEKRLPGNWEWVNSSEHTIVARNTQGKIEEKIFLKIFLDRTVLEGVKSLIRGSRSKRSIRQSKTLSDLGFNVPEVYCWGNCYGKDFVVTKAIPAIGYADYIKNNIEKIYRSNDDEIVSGLIKNKRKLVSGIGELVGALHREGLIHGDLRPNNILVKDESQEYEFYLIDNERNRLHKHPTNNLIIKNLVQIMMFFSDDLSSTYRCRFYKNYFNAVERFKIDEQRMIIQAVHIKVSERLKGRSRE